MGAALQDSSILQLRLVQHHRAASLANFLRRMGADEWVLGVAVAVYSLGEMVGSAVGKLATKRLREAPAGPRRCLLETMVFGVVGSILYVVADDVGQSPNLRAWAPWVVVCVELTSSTSTPSTQRDRWRGVPIPLDRARSVIARTRRIIRCTGHWFPHRSS